MLGLEPINLLIRVPVILLALTVHEFCHAYFAYRMGDSTAARQGRLSLNPLVHLDMLGTLCLMFAPIGWAKPVPINPLNFRDRRKGILLSTAAGPLSNLAQAVVFALILRFVIQAGGGLEPFLDRQVHPFFYAAFLLCYLAVLINVALAVFNCLPLYPLDGFHITLQLLPPQSQPGFASMATYGPFLILGLIVVQHAADVDILGRLIMPPVNFLLDYVTGLKAVA